ncbi:MAG TPA: hypothetical protein VMC83_05225 [Streptosporangiaceae bacterium]|nr:hypothetical protein [Streptosporangiaceae bacterium]
MRLAKGIAAAACFLVGLWLMLRATGLLTAVLHAVPRWWPTLPAAVGAAILVRSRRPGPHTAVSLVLIAASGVTFTIVHHAITRTVWPFAASAGLMATGLALAYLAARASPATGTARSQRVVVAFRSAARPTSAGLARIRVYAFCGRLDLDITDCLPGGSRRKGPLMIEIVACLADVTLVVRTEAEIHHHQAFVMPFRGPARGEVLRDTATKREAIVASVAFFSRVTVP